MDSLSTPLTSIATGVGNSAADAAHIMQSSAHRTVERLKKAAFAMVNLALELVRAVKVVA
ncbi:hypothetical protein GCM10011396_50480 [Undibacterium terreum]|uniref:Uncharacterized protein n=1 Tax=Undibacterium terreum TaxID=1224302 RepID=A0A916XQJ6_9BURK|nr:hypothetical protein GCM10011396_50480 [Undibacterium terreum]